MNLERIAEIEGLIPVCVQDGVYLHLSPMEATELCRLARLGLRVEEAPKTRAKITPTAWHGPTWLAYEPLPKEWGGKRVALVVLEDSK